ncbi:MAG: EAL domain-containing protein, partial [Alphaproteobacteria bacterium]
ITFAEQTGLICDFDLAMCEKVVNWLDKGGRKGRHYMVAVNLSGSSIGSPRFVDALHDLLQKKNSLRHRILFEITESARITDLEAVNRSVQSLRDAGHKICLDDFGAGAAAFQYLRALDIDVVKIDGGYVRNALSTDKGTAFLKAMAGMCKDLGIVTVAEWVEDEQCLSFLRECGVDYGQGYLFGAPSSDITMFEAPHPNLFN